MSPDELRAEGDRLSALLDAALDFFKQQVRAAAEADNDYTLARRQAWVVCPSDPHGTKPADREWTAARRENWVDAETAKQHHVLEIAQGMKTGALEAIRSRRAQIDLLRSVASAYKSEAELAR